MLLSINRSIIALTVFSLAVVSSCFNYQFFDISSGGEQSQQITGGAVQIAIFIPDYRKLAERNDSRVIAPQTAYIRLSVADEPDTFIQHGNLLELDMSDVMPVENAPSNLPGGIWNGTFTALECRTYMTGSLKIELLDRDNKVITKGVNQTDVTIEPDHAAQAVFFTTPEKFNSISGSLNPGEMRFWKVSMMGGYSYQLTLSAEGSYPDIIVFNDDGTFRECYTISTGDEGSIFFNPAESQDCYLGLWADSGAVSSYSVALSYNFDRSQEDFSGGFNGWTATASGFKSSPPLIVVKDEKSAIEFASSSMRSGGRVTLSRAFIINEPAVLSFSVKTDIGGSLYVNTFFKLYIDNVEQASYDGLGFTWRSDTIAIPIGSHVIKWVLEKDSNSYFLAPCTNKVWLADISFSPDNTTYLDIQPRGPKDTYVGGFPIQFTAWALNQNGSIRSGLSGIVYSGPGVNSVSGLFTPPAVPGTYKVTASLEGKLVSSDIITVHSADYLREPWTNPVTGKTYNGYQGVTGSINTLTGNVTFTYPSEKNISADGFVTLVGESGYSGNLNVSVVKDGNSSLLSTYTLPYGNFCIRIWLRFGSGQYRINVAGQTVFIVNNTSADTGVGGDPRFLYPSSIIQSDDFRITNLLTHLLYGVSNEADKIRIIHDYLARNTVYDFDSVYGTRKAQDALSILGTKYHIDPQYEPDGHYLAVCEGYANAAAALLRAAGIETRYIPSVAMNHAWNQVYTGGSWKLLDVTWDDPADSITGADYGPFYVQYDYYLLAALDGVNGDHFGGAIDSSRSVAIAAE